MVWGCAKLFIPATGMEKLPEKRCPSSELMGWTDTPPVLVTHLHICGSRTDGHHDPWGQNTMSFTRTLGAPTSLLHVALMAMKQVEPVDNRQSPASVSIYFMGTKAKESSTDATLGSNAALLWSS